MANRAWEKASIAGYWSSCEGSYAARKDEPDRTETSFTSLWGEKRKDSVSSTSSRSRRYADHVNTGNRRENNAPARDDTVNISVRMTGITELPRFGRLDLLDKTSEAALRHLDPMTTRDLVQLVRHGNPIEIGFGIFAASQARNVAALLSFHPLLDDDELTLPYPLPVAFLEQHATHTQTISEYLSATYLEWFGIDVDGSSARFHDYFSAVYNADHLTKPWILRMQNCGTDSSCLSNVISRINELPNLVQGYIALLAYRESIFSVGMTQSRLCKLGKDTVQALEFPGNLESLDPMLQANDGMMAESLARLCRNLLRLHPCGDATF
jgi:hypothetical protein